MGKAIKWFRGLLGLKKSDNTSPATPNSGTKPPPKRRRSFIKSNTNHNRNPDFFKSPEENDGFDQEQEHAILAAEFAVMAANRAAEVVWLTSGDLNVSNGNMNTAAYVNTSGFGSREVWAAVKIQSHFRAYLSRRALRALKGLVKLQALVRGHIVRRQETEKLMQMQAVSRARRRACALRAQMSESAQSTKFCHLNHPDPATPEKIEHFIRRGAKNEQSLLLKRNGSRSNFRVDPDKEKLNYHYSMDEGSWDSVYLAKSGLIDEGKSDKIMEIDTGKYHITPKRRNLIQSSLYPSAPDPNSHSFTTSKDSTLHQAIFSPSSGEVQSPSPLKYTDDVDKASFCTAETSPQFISSKGASFMRSEPFTPTRSDASRSCLSGYSDYYPNYMSYTESSKAKVRSLSAPRQRTQLDRSNTAKRFSIHSGYSEVRTQRVPSALHTSFTNKAYPGSGRLNRLGMPMGGDGVRFSGGILNKY